MRDHKEIWIDHYEEAKERGLSDDDAAKAAQERTADYLASLIDAARDRAKYE